MDVLAAGVGEDLPALLRVRPVEPDDDRIARHVEPVDGREDPARTRVAGGDTAEDVEEDRRALRVARDHLEGVHDALRAAAAAEIAEVRRAPARLRDDVHGGHSEPRAVGEDADVPVELHVGDALLARERLDRVGGGRIAPFCDVRMAEEAAVVDGELRVERLHLTLRGDDQRVDLAEHRVELDERAIELLDDRRDLLLLGRILDAARVDEPARDPRLEALERIEVEPDQRVRALLRDLLDLDAALRREHEERLLCAAVEGDGEVVLARDVRRLLDPERADDVAVDVNAEDVARLRLGVGGIVRELHAAGLAAPPGQHLRLDDDRAGELLGRLARLLRGGGPPAPRGRDPYAAEAWLYPGHGKVHRRRGPTAR